MFEVFEDSPAGSKSLPRPSVLSTRPRSQSPDLTLSKFESEPAVSQDEVYMPLISRGWGAQPQSLLPQPLLPQPLLMRGACDLDPAME